MNPIYNSKPMIDVYGSYKSYANRNENDIHLVQFVQQALIP